MKNILIAAAIFVPFSAPAFASETLMDNDYFKIGSVAVRTEVTESDLTAADAFPVPLRNEPKVVAAIVNGGIEAWNVINSGSPDANLSSSYASAIPGFDFNWASYSGWKKKEVVYIYSVANLMQVDVINIKYAVSFYYNGEGLSPADTTESSEVQRNALKGHYITNFTVRPISTNIKWGWKFSLNVRMSDPMNAGTLYNPVAYMQADLNNIVSSPLSTRGSVWTYAVNGLGEFRDLSSQNRELTKQVPVLEPVEIFPVSWN